MPSTAETFPAIPLRERMSVIGLVLLMHGALALFWLTHPEQARIVVNELSVSLAMQQAPIAQPEPSRSQPATKPKRADKPVAKLAETPVQHDVAELAPQPLPLVAAPPLATTPVAVATAPVPDTEPDYTAGYLKNPRPVYPLVAQRMGWEGRVMLNVEVLSEGTCGAVNVFRSSGHEVLDNAAMNTVKTWRFTPARHAGRAVTQWFRVPINFSLEDNKG